MSELGFVHRFLASPSASSRVLLLLHGTGGDESDLLPLGREVDSSAALLSPRGRVSENGAPRFFRRFAEGVFDEEDVVRRAHELADFVAAAALKYGFEEKNLTALGYSNGANIAAAMMFLRSETLKAAVLLRAMVLLSNPAVPPALAGRRVFISSGRFDPIVPLENAQRLAGLLKSGGAEVTAEIHNASHGVTPEDVSAAKRWISA